MERYLKSPFQAVLDFCNHPMGQGHSGVAWVASTEARPVLRPTPPHPTHMPHPVCPIGSLPPCLQPIVSCRLWGWPACLIISLQLVSSLGSAVVLECHTGMPKQQSHLLCCPCSGVVLGVPGGQFDLGATLEGAPG